MIDGTGETEPPPGSGLAFDALDGRWPGSRWWRLDLHVHTPGSHDFGGDASYADVLGAALTNGLDAIAITDHNSAEGVAALGDEETPVCVFPGVELTTSEGAHLIVVFDVGTSADRIKSFLGRVGVDGDHFGTPDARAAEGYLRCLEIAVEDFQALCIAAHADLLLDGRHQTSLLHALNDGAAVRAVLNSPHLHAVELVGSDPDDTRKLCGGAAAGAVARPHLRGSDSHAAEYVGRASTWVKMTKPTLEGLRLAFADGQASVRVHQDEDPNLARASMMIESIEISAAKLLGRSGPLGLGFNPWLNAVIGGRGTGKSSIVEFLRLALDRVDELPAALRTGFDLFAQVPASRSDRGMLTADTTVTVTYVKDGTRFRIRWEADGRSIEEQTGEGVWEPSEGDIASRFPSRIYSQKEIFELAVGPEALLQVIDEAPAVSRADLEVTLRETAARFARLRAEGRELKTAQDDAPRLAGEHNDVVRKLAVFEASDHSAVLHGYARKQEQSKAVSDLDEALQEVSSAIRRAASAVNSELDATAFAEDDTIESGLLAAAERRRERLERTKKELEALAETNDADTSAWNVEPERLAWQASVKAAETAYGALTAKLAAEGAGDPSEYANLVRSKQDIEDRLNDLRDKAGELSAKAGEAGEVLEALSDARRELSRRRTDFLTSTLTGNQHVQIRLVPYGDRLNAEASLRDVLGTEAFGKDIGAGSEDTGLIGELYRDFEDISAEEFEHRLTVLRNRLAECASGGAPEWSVQDQRFVTHLRGLTPEALDRLAYWSPDDTVTVEYSRDGDGQDFIPIEQGSPGQKTAAILAFLLAYGEEPIVLDQPEDDLDNRLIYALVVQQLRENKQRRQIITVTHNANIVVNGDAELVVVLDFPARHGQVVVDTAGGLQEQSVREEICTVMEGGRTAFEERYRRIGRSHAVG